MTGIKGIRTKVESMQNTHEITKAMEMAAASEMHKAQEWMHTARPYTEKIHNAAAHMALANPECEHPFMVACDIKRAGLVMVTTDKGLCGGLDTNVLRAVVTQLHDPQNKGTETQTTAIGTEGMQSLGHVGAKVVSNVVHLGDTPHLGKPVGAIRVQLDAFNASQIDAVYLAYTRFINTMKQEPVVEQLLPLTVDKLAQSNAEEQAYSQDYIYEPDAQMMVDELPTRYVEALVYQTVTENMISEQSARMVVMKVASDSAKNATDGLRLVYNKTHQAAITKELSKIVSGAAAV